MQCSNKEKCFSVPTPLRSALYSHAPDGCHKENEGPSKLRVLTPVVFAYLSHRLFWNSGRGLRYILRTIAASETMVISLWRFRTPLVTSCAYTLLCRTLFCTLRRMTYPVVDLVDSSAYLQRSSYD